MSKPSIPNKYSCKRNKLQLCGPIKRSFIHPSESIKLIIKKKIIIPNKTTRQSIIMIKKNTVGFLITTVSVAINILSPVELGAQHQLEGRQATHPPHTPVHLFGVHFNDFIEGPAEWLKVIFIFYNNNLPNF